MGFLEGKKALITGLASERSIAYGIAQAMRAQTGRLVARGGARLLGQHGLK